MNERIKELLNQAGIYQPDRFDAIDGSNQMEKFAQLIVKECMEQVFYTIEDQEQDNISGSIRDRITQHFGVKE